MWTTKREIVDEIRARIREQEEKDAHRFATIDEKVSALRFAPPPECTACAALKSRIEDLELWRAKVHRMLIEVSPSGNEKLSKAGKAFSKLYR